MQNVGNLGIQLRDISGRKSGHFLLTKALKIYLSKFFHYLENQVQMSTNFTIFMHKIQLPTGSELCLKETIPVLLANSSIHSQTASYSNSICHLGEPSLKQNGKFWTMSLKGGGLGGPPSEIKEGVIVDPCCYIAFVPQYFLGSHEKISQKSQNLNKISEFQNFVKLRFCITLTNEKLT